MRLLALEKHYRAIYKFYLSCKNCKVSVGEAVLSTHNLIEKKVSKNRYTHVHLKVEFIIKRGYTCTLYAYVTVMICFVLDTLSFL